MHTLAVRDSDDPDGPPVAYISGAVYGQPSIDPDISWQWDIVKPFHAGILYFSDPLLAPAGHRLGNTACAAGVSGFG
ncbi:hypothetical protein ACQP1O_22500 [Nocardia sp. CA-151230]|uniref:hypothetical protein n=1 Tax=Nocardia sp. CA-151230 TaxID=3239982 RepID=UPI003D89E18E